MTVSRSPHPTAPPTERCICFNGGRRACADEAAVSVGSALAAVSSVAAGESLTTCVHCHRVMQTVSLPSSSPALRPATRPPPAGPSLTALLPAELRVCF